MINYFTDISPSHTFTDQDTIHRDSPRFILDVKTGVNPRKLSISTDRKGFIRVAYGVCTFSVRFLYESTTVHGGTTMDNKGKRRWHYGQTRCCYGSLRCLYGQAVSATGSYDCLRITGNSDNDF